LLPPFARLLDCRPAQRHDCGLSGATLESSLQSNDPESSRQRSHVRPCRQTEWRSRATRNGTITNKSAVGGREFASPATTTITHHHLHNQRKCAKQGPRSLGSTVHVRGSLRPHKTAQLTACESQCYTAASIRRSRSQGERPTHHHAHQRVRRVPV